MEEVSNDGISLNETRPSPFAEAVNPVILELCVEKKKKKTVKPITNPLTKPKASTSGSSGEKKKARVLRKMSHVQDLFSDDSTCTIDIRVNL